MASNVGLRKLAHSEYGRAAYRVAGDYCNLDIRFEFRGKHAAVIFQSPATQRHYIFPATPSDSQRGALNAEADMRRLVGTFPDLTPIDQAPKRTRIKLEKALPYCDGPRAKPSLSKAFTMPGQIPWEYVDPTQPFWRAISNGREIAKRQGFDEFVDVVMLMPATTHFEYVSQPSRAARR